MFLYLAYENVHIPPQVPEEYEDSYQFIENRDRRALAGKSKLLTMYYYDKLTENAKKLFVNNSTLCLNSNNFKG